MLQLFKKKNYKHKEEDPTVTAAQVHADVFSISDEFVKQSNDLLFDVDKEKEHQIKTLNDLGFYNAGNLAKQKTELINRQNVNYYSNAYPLYKFITKEVVGEICKKYNLYLVDVCYYTGSIPDKNKKQIVEFRVKEKDLNNNWRFGGMRHLSDAKTDYQAKLYDEKEKERLQKVAIANKSQSLVECCDLKIIAPESEIDMRYFEKKGNQLVLKDPIVLQPVIGGYLVVSAWGDEAADVVNENMN